MDHKVDDSASVAETTNSHANASSDGDDASRASRDEVKEVKRLTENETRRVRIWRAVVGAVILGAGALVSWGTHFYLSRQLQDETEGKFHLFANSIEDISLAHFEDLASALKALSQEITAQSISRNMTLPFFTMQDWEVHAGEARSRGNIEALWFSPLLKNYQEIEQFNAHAAANLDKWLNDSAKAIKSLHPELENVTYASTGSTTVWTFADVTRPWMQAPVKQGPSSPMWTLSPTPRGTGATMLDFRVGEIPLSVAWQVLFDAVDTTKEFVLGAMGSHVGGDVDKLVGKEAHLAIHTALHGDNVNTNTSVAEQAHGYALHPVFDGLNSAESEVRGYLSALVGFDAFLVDILPAGIRGIQVVIQNTCNSSFTYELDGNEATFQGAGDLSDPTFKHLQRTIVFDGIYDDVELASKTPGHCRYSYIMTPTSLYWKDNDSITPLVITIGVAAIFLVMALAFFIYDMQVEKRNNKMVDTAARSNAIVSSIFPGAIRDRLLEDESHTKPGMSLLPTKSHLKSFLNKDPEDASGRGDQSNGIVLRSKPIADLFTETTVMFADISGFTAWSSVREPSQVFTLLETVYRAFDGIARRRGVFKVETVGDCYVAVCGLPDPRKDHAVVMARFARDCLQQFNQLSRKLEVLLGPDTGDLGMRIGIHSGPVTAGVLRGERSRFQLFGDTMNTASRMEATGEAGRVHVSEETAKLLASSGKGSWLRARDSLVDAKGKGLLETFWLRTREDGEAEGSSVGEEAMANDERHGARETMESNKTSRLIDWNVEVMLKLLKQIVQRREALGIKPDGRPHIFELRLNNRLIESDLMILDEVEEVIRLPSHRSDAQDVATMTLPEIVVDELVEYVSGIAAMYNRNPFHNFEHASHVTMSVVKLLSRIVAPSEVDFEKSKVREGQDSLHDHTYGITSDPLTQFACVLSALIHDADHPGVPNAQLVKERNPRAVLYKGKSVAEQNSVELAWGLLMEERYENLRATIYGSEAEMLRFRQLVVNSVMATDIVDKELKALRNARWEKAFSMEVPRATDEEENVNRKATIVIEHLLQASDVAHTMQHWHIYRKWNERFFLECYQAYRDGRAELDPSESWYKGEMGFFDFYIIPLSKKLKECGVFGVSSDEYLNYATKNRKEWEERGQEIVASMVEKVKLSVSAVTLGASDHVVGTTTGSLSQLMNTDVNSSVDDDKPWRPPFDTAIDESWSDEGKSQQPVNPLEN